MIEMFCPVCGTLSYPDDRGWIKCPDYKCEYEGPLSGEDGKGSEFTDPMTGETIDLANTTASSVLRVNESWICDVATDWAASTRHASKIGRASCRERV